MRARVASLVAIALCAVAAVYEVRSFAPLAARALAEQDHFPTPALWCESDLAAARCFLAGTILAAILLAVAAAIGWRRGADLPLALALAAPLWGTLVFAWWRARGLPMEGGATFVGGIVGVALGTVGTAFAHVTAAHAWRRHPEARRALVMTHVLAGLTSLWTLFFLGWEFVIGLSA